MSAKRIEAPGAAVLLPVVAAFALLAIAAPSASAAPTIAKTSVSRELLPDLVELALAPYVGREEAKRLAAAA
jgi:hypothetical protein